MPHKIFESGNDMLTLTMVQNVALLGISEFPERGIEAKHFASITLTRDLAEKLARVLLEWVA